MEKPIQIHFSKKLGEIKASYSLPKTATYRLLYADRTYWEHPSFSVLEQYYQTQDIFLYLGEVRTTINLSIELNCVSTNIYWVYQLEDEYLLLINKEPKKGQLKSKGKSYRTVYLTAGDHTADFLAGGHCLIFYFVVNKELLLRYQDTLHFLKKLLRKLDSEHPEFAFSSRLPLDSKTMPSLRRLFALGRLDALALEERIPPIILRLLAIARQSHSQEAFAADKSISKLQQIRQQALTHITMGEVFTIGELAEQFGLDVDYLRQTHKTHFQESLQSFITKSRLTEAYRQIKEEHRTPTEVSFSLGFYDGAAFTKAFKKAYGITPSVLYKRYKRG